MAFLKPMQVEVSAMRHLFCVNSDSMKLSQALLHGCFEIRVSRVNPGQQMNPTVKSNEVGNTNASNIKVAIFTECSFSRELTVKWDSSLASIHVNITA